MSKVLEEIDDMYNEASFSAKKDFISDILHSLDKLYTICAAINDGVFIVYHEHAAMLEFGDYVDYYNIPLDFSSVRLINYKGDINLSVDINGDRDFIIGYNCSFSNISNSDINIIYNEIREAYDTIKKLVYKRRI